MIRALVLILGLVLGLCLALLYGGTLGHLRMASGWTGWALPGWTEGLEDGAGVTRGQGALNGAALRWRLSGLAGLAVSLSGPDWQAQGLARPSREGLAIGDLSGLIPLGWLRAGEGVLALDSGEMVLGFDGAVQSARIEGQARGSDPEGAVTLLWQDGWQLISR